MTIHRTPRPRRRRRRYNDGCCLWMFSAFWPLLEMFQ